MSKIKTHYVCQNCGSTRSKWSGRCEDCGEWNCMQEEIISGKQEKMSNTFSSTELSFNSLSADINEYQRIPTCLSELDRVLGGGLVQGSVILIGGDPGIGKSTLLLQLVSILAQNSIKCAYISGEESSEQIKLRARRLGLSQAPVQLLSATNIHEILNEEEVLKDPLPQLLLSEFEYNLLKYDVRFWVSLTATDRKLIISKINKEILKLLTQNDISLAISAIRHVQ